MLMHFLLLICGISIALHKAALIWGLSRNGLHPHNRYAFWAGFTMLALSLTAVIAQVDLLLFIGYAVYRMSVAIQIIAGPHKAKRQTVLIPVNIGMSLLAVLAACTLWWIFPIAYATYWVLTLQISRKRLQHRMV